MLMVNTLLIIFFPNPLPSWGQQQMPHAVFPRRAERGVSGAGAGRSRGGRGGSRGGCAAAGFRLLGGHGLEGAVLEPGDIGSLQPVAVPEGGPRLGAELLWHGRPRPPRAFPPQAVKWRLLPTGSRTLPRKAWPRSFSPGPHRSFAYRSAGLSQRLQGSSRGAPVGSVPSPGTGTAGRAGCSRAGAQHRPRPPCRAPGVTPSETHLSSLQAMGGERTEQHHQNPAEPLLEDT